MIAMLILTLVCIAWLEIIGIQSARKEARRREAVERLVGMMDAFMYDPVLRDNNFLSITKKGKVSFPSIFQSYCINITNGFLSIKKNDDPNEIPSIFDSELSPIGYRLFVTNAIDISQFGTAWGGAHWLVGELYDHSGKKEDNWKPFFSLPVCLGW